MSRIRTAGLATLAVAAFTATAQAQQQPTFAATKVEGTENVYIFRYVGHQSKIIVAVDWIPIEGVQFRAMADTYVPDIEESLKKVIAMDWERMIPGHPGPGGRLGTKDDARADLAYLQDLSAAVKQAVNDNKSYNDAEKEIKLPKYEKWGGYGPFPPMNIERYYDFWNRGI